MQDICHFWARICFLATPLARCPLAVVQRNGPNLSTSASRLLLAHEQHCTSTLLQSLLSSPLPDDQWGGACSYATSSGTRFQGGGRFPPFMNHQLQLHDCEPGLEKGAKMGDKWTHQCSLWQSMQF